MPPELQPHASPDRFARAEEAEQEQNLVRELENWLSPPALPLLETPRATLRVVCRPQPDEEEPSRYRLAVQFLLLRPRTGEKARPLRDLIDLVVRATHEQELFPPADWEFIQWIADTYRHHADGADTLVLSDAELLQWLTRWGHTPRLECDGKPLRFQGQIAVLTPHLDNGDKELSFTHQIELPGGKNHSIADAKFFNRQSPLVLLDNTFYLVRNAPPPKVLKYLARMPSVPVRKLSHRLLLHLRKTQSSHGVDWERLCVAHPAKPQFIFELLDDTVRLRLLARSQRDQSVWFWNGHEWVRPTRPRRRRPRATNRKFSTTRASNRRRNGCKNWIGSCRNRDCGSVTRTKIFSARWPAPGPSAPARRNFSATRRFTACSCTRASSSRGSSSRAAALTGWPFPPNGRPKDSNFPRPISNGSPPPPAASSSCRIPAGWNWTPPPCRARTRRWPKWAWTASSPCRKRSAWSTSRIWTKAS